MPTATTKVVAVTGWVLAILGGIGWCVYLERAKIATPWYWVVFVALVLTVTAGFAWSLRHGIGPSRASWSPRRPRTLALSQHALFYGAVAQAASRYSDHVLGREWASGLFLGLAGVFMITAIIALVMFLRPPW